MTRSLPEENQRFFSNESRGACAIIEPGLAWMSHPNRNDPLRGRNINELTTPYQCTYPPDIVWAQDRKASKPSCSTIGCYHSDLSQDHSNSFHSKGIDRFASKDEDLYDATLSNRRHGPETSVINALEHKLSESGKARSAPFLPKELDWFSTGQVHEHREPRLLSLPLEIRQQVFSYVLMPLGNNSFFRVDDEVCQVVRWSVEWDAETAQVSAQAEHFQIQHWEITKPLLVCRQIYLELMPMFYKQQKFVFPRIETLGKFLHGIGGHRRKFIRNVVVSDEDSTPRTAIQAYKLLGESSHLQNLEIMLDSCEYIIGDRSLRARSRLQSFYSKVWAWVPEINSYAPLLIDRERYLEDELDGIEILRKFRGLKSFIITDRHLIDRLDENGEICPTKDSILEYKQAFGEDLAMHITAPKAIVPGIPQDCIPALCPKRLRSLLQSDQQGRTSSSLQKYFGLNPNLLSILEDKEGRPFVRVSRQFLQTVSSFLKNDVNGSKEGLSTWEPLVNVEDEGQESQEEATACSSSGGISSQAFR